jgi:hypothetical protein
MGNTQRLYFAVDTMNFKAKYKLVVSSTNLS